MTDHSPDHAERAREVAAQIAEQHGHKEAAEQLRSSQALSSEDGSLTMIDAMLAYADERVAAALRGRDAVVETGSCFLCAGKCRGHSFGHADQWKPEPGSAAALHDDTVRGEGA